MKWRLIIDGENNGYWNIALDKALLLCFKKIGMPTLRFYQWDEPYLSIGYFQKLTTSLIEKCQSKNIHIVKRPTGGKAVLHFNELTYSIVAPYHFFYPTRNILAVYNKIAEIFLMAFQKMGIEAELFSSNSIKKSTFFCFENPSYYEIVYKGKKMMGSAQRYHENILLQHGSLPLQRDLNLIIELFGNEHIEKWISLKEILGSSPDINSIIHNIKEAFSKFLNAEFELEEPSEEEKAMAKLIISQEKG